MANLAVEPMILYMKQLIHMLQTEDPTDPQLPTYERLLQKLEVRDPTVIDDVEQLGHDPNIEMFATNEILNEMKKDFGESDDQLAIDTFNSYRQKIVDSNLSEDEKRDLTNTIDDVIEFINIPAGTEVNFEDKYPQYGLEQLYKAFPEIKLKQAIDHVHSTLPDASSQGSSQHSSDVDDDIDDDN